MFTATLKKTLGLFSIFLLPALGLAQGGASQWVSMDNLRDLVDMNTIAHNATVEVVIDKEDERLKTEVCPAALFSNSKNNKLWGRTFLEVQCLGSSTAPFFVTAEFKVWAPVLVVKENIGTGEAIAESALEYRTMDITQLPGEYINDVAVLTNKTAARQLWPGSLLKPEWLKGRPLLRYGDTVKITVKGPGFNISGQGVALETAEMGDIVKIKNTQGKVLHGVAIGDMLVEVTL